MRVCKHAIPEIEEAFVKGGAMKDHRGGEKLSLSQNVKGGAMKDHRGGEKLCLSHKFAANCRGDDRYGIELTISAIDVIPSGF